MTKKKPEEELQKGDGQNEQQNEQAADPKDAKITELTDTLQRLQAEFENYKKRVEKEKEQFSKYSNHKLIAGLLPLLDSFELAIKNSNGADPEKFRKGVEMIYAQFFSMLESEGLRPIKARGEKFDPYRHEALMQAESDDEHVNIVLEEFHRGYMLRDAVLRTSKVKIGVKKQDTKQNTSS